MSKKEWLRMCKAGENLTVEYKRQAPKLERLARSFSAFSNSSGGTMFFGVEDDGNMVGLENLEGTRDLLEQVAQFHCEPEAEIKMTDWTPYPGTDILVVQILEAQLKPVYAVSPNNPDDRWPFFRSDAENLPLDRKSLKAMSHHQSREVDEEELKKLDRHSIHMLNHLSEHPRQTLNQLAKSANIGAHRAKKIIVNLEKNGWIHGYFNEKRREYSLVIKWKHR